MIAALATVLILGAAPSPVMDGAGILSPADEAMLASKLSSFAKSEGVEVVIATVPAVPRGETADGRAARLALEWEVGSRSGDQGVVIAFFRDDREFSIHVSEKVPHLSGAETNRIASDHMMPYFRNGGVGVGFEAGAREVMDTIRGNRTAYAAGTKPRRRGGKIGKVGAAVGATGVLLMICLGLYVRVLMGPVDFNRTDYNGTRRGNSLFGAIMDDKPYNGVFSKRGGFGGGGSSGSW